MKKLLNLFLAGLMLLGLALVPGCGIFKKRAVDLEKTSFSQTSESSKKADSTTKKTDKSVTTETEEIDAVVKVPGKKVSEDKQVDAEALRDSLIKGMTLINNSAVEVKTQLDTLTGKLNTTADIKPQDVTVKAKRTKTTVNDKTEETAVKRSENNKEATEQKSKKKATVAEPKGLAWLWGIVVAVAVILVGGLLIYFWPKRKGMTITNEPQDGIRITKEAGE